MDDDPLHFILMQIVAMSGIVHRQINGEGPTVGVDARLDSFSILRKLDVAFPFDMQQTLRQQRVKAEVCVCLCLCVCVCVCVCMCVCVLLTCSKP